MQRRTDVDPRPARAGGERSTLDHDQEAVRLEALGAELDRVLRPQIKAMLVTSITASKYTAACPISICTFEILFHHDRPHERFTATLPRGLE